MRIDRGMARLMAVVFCAAAVAASAEGAPILNESFEDGAFVANAAQGTMTLNVGSTTITNWTVVTDALASIEFAEPLASFRAGWQQVPQSHQLPSRCSFRRRPRRQSQPTWGPPLTSAFYLGSYTARWGGPPVAITATAGSASETCTVTHPQH